MLYICISGICKNDTTPLLTGLDFLKGEKMASWVNKIIHVAS